MVIEEWAGSTVNAITITRKKSSSFTVNADKFAFN